MSHEIEANFVSDFEFEASQCRHCTSFSLSGGQGHCSEMNADIEPDGHCDFFQSTN